MGVQNRRNVEVSLQVDSVKQLMEHITSHLHIPEKIMNPPSHSDSSPAADSSWASSVPVQIPKLELDQGSISQAANNEDQSHKDPEKKVMKKHKFSEVQKKPSN